MCFLFSGGFWGIVLVLFGLSIIVKVAFNIHFPFFRILVALIIIYFGLRVLMGGTCIRTHRNTVLFNESHVTATDAKNDYNILFGKGTIDLTSPELAAKSSRVRVNTVFGSGTIKINPDVPTLIEINSAFAGSRLPDGNAIAFGKYVYKNKSYGDTVKNLKVDASVVFGSLDIIEK
jgi:predicted membrane protein